MKCFTSSPKPMTTIIVVLMVGVGIIHQVNGFTVRPNIVISNPLSKNGIKNANGISSLFPFTNRQQQHQIYLLNNNQKIIQRQKLIILKMSTPDFDSDDPFLILGLSEPTADKQVIKRAYKRMALKYHPDMTTTRGSTEEEKQEATAKFAKINWAYNVLSGKEANDKSYKGSSSSSKKSSSGSGTGWEPPHRRTSSYSTGGSTDWRDFMPKYDESEYDAGGDSFGAIFSDLFAGAAGSVAGGAVGGAGIFRDFVEFLERNVDGYSPGGSGSGSSSSNDDAELRVLLQTGSVEEIANEMDDTELVVQQLQSKIKGLSDDILILTAEAKMASRYAERLDAQEKIDELQARKKVAEGYVKKAQKRLLALQMKYKELIVGGDNDPVAGGRSRGGYSSTTSSSSSSSSSPYGSTSSSYGSTYSSSRSAANDNSTPSPSSSSSSASSSRRQSSSGSSNSKDDEDQWMNEGFGGSSYGRGRGSSRRRSSRQTTTESQPRSTESYSSRSSYTTSSSPSSSPSEQQQQQPQQPRRDAYTSSSSSRTYSSSYSSSSASSRPGGSYGGSSSSSSNNNSSSNNDDNIPPHRRTPGSFRSQEEDKRRMRELKVEEEFDKLKKDLGL